MGWKEAMEQIGGANLSFLTEDGEVLNFVVAGDPVLVEGKYQKQPTARVGIPIFSLDGFSLLVIGKRVVRRLNKYRDKFKEYAFRVIRHGEAGSSDTRYELNVISEQDIVARLFKVAEAGVDKDELQEAIDEARRVAVT